MRFISVLTGSLMGLALATTVAAQSLPRNIPADAPRGRFTSGQFPQVFINGKPMRLAPGARIVTPENRTVTPNLVAADSAVRYRLDAQGQVQMVWILSAEAARRR